MPETDVLDSTIYASGISATATTAISSRSTGGPEPRRRESPMASRGWPRDNRA